MMSQHDVTVNGFEASRVGRSGHSLAGCPRIALLLVAGTLFAILPRETDWLLSLPEVEYR
jgi:hypothetical protein